jgi:hypothetical protein
MCEIQLKYKMKVKNQKINIFPFLISNFELRCIEICGKAR